MSIVVGQMSLKRPCRHEHNNFTIWTLSNRVKLNKYGGEDVSVKFDAHGRDGSL